MYLSVLCTLTVHMATKSQEQPETPAVKASMDDREQDEMEWEGMCKYVHLKLVFSNSAP